jgi:hypothetical protein
VAVCELEGETPWVVLPGVGAVRATEPGRAVGYAVDAANEPKLRDAWHRAALPLVCQWFGAEAIHAAAVCDPRGVVAFAGVSGSGKSTLVAWLGGRGFEPWADDVLLWQGSHEQLVTRALPFSVRPRPGIGSLERLPCWERTTFGAESVPLRALILLEPQTATTSTTNTPVRVGPSQALQQIMLHALCFGFAVANQKRRLVASYARLCSELPCYSVTLTRGEESLRVLEQWLGE